MHSITVVSHISATPDKVWSAHRLGAPLYPCGRRRDPREDRERRYGRARLHILDHEEPVAPRELPLNHQGRERRRRRRCHVERQLHTSRRARRRGRRHSDRRLSGWPRRSSGHFLGPNVSSRRLTGQPAPGSAQLAQTPPRCSVEKTASVERRDPAAERLHVLPELLVLLTLLLVDLAHAGDLEVGLQVAQRGGEVVQMKGQQAAIAKLANG